MKLKYNVNLNVVADENNGKAISVDGTKKYALDEAIEATGNGRFNILIVIFSGFVIMGATIENISIAFVLPFANCDLNMTTTEQGLISSIAFLGIVVSSHFWGFLADTWGRKKVIRLAATCSLVSAFLSAFAVNAPLLVVLRFSVGIFVSGLQASVFSYASEFFTKEKAPRAASFVSMFMPMVFIYSSVTAMILIPMNWSFSLYFIKFAPWRLYMIVISFVNAVNMISFSILPETPKFLLAMNQPEEALSVLRQMYQMNTGCLKESYPVQHLIPESSGNKLVATKGLANMMNLVWNQTKPIFVAPYVESTTKLCYIVFMLFAIGHGSALWMPEFFIQLQANTDTNKTLCDVVGHERITLTSDQECTVDNSNITTFIIMFSIGIVFTTLSGLISFYLDKVSPRIIVPTWIIISGISSLALNYLTQFYTIVVAYVTFLSSSLCAAIVSAISVSLYPTNIRAMATCFIYMFGRIGGLAGGNLISALFETKCGLIFNIYAAFTFSCVIVFLSLKTEAPTPVQDDRNRCAA